MRSPSTLFLDSRGDVLVSDRNGSLIRIRPDTGVQSAIATFDDGLRGIAEEADGSLLLVEKPARLWRVDPDTGTSALLSTGGLLTNAMGVVVDDAGEIFVTNLPFGGRPGALPPPSLVRVDPDTGAQQLVYTSRFNALYHLALEHDGTLLA